MRTNTKTERDENEFIFNDIHRRVRLYITLCGNNNSISRNRWF